MFRRYDIRGLVGSELTGESVQRLIQAFAYDLYRLGLKSVCVAHDARESSSEFADIAIQGLVSSGFDVISIGLMPTPAAHFTMHHMGLDALLVVTASHNPVQFNGLKFCLKDRLYYAEDIDRLKTYYEQNASNDGKGMLRQVDVSEAYINHFPCEGIKPFKIAWDVGAGALSHLIQQIVEKLPGEHIVANSDKIIDPNRVEDIQALSQIVVEKDCDFGLAFDGDADRLGVVDGKGRAIKGDQLLSLFAKDIAKKNPGSTVVAEIKSSFVLTENLKKLGLLPVLTKTGYPNIKQAMKIENCVLGGEVSGHFFFKDEHPGYDDGLYAAFRFLRALSSMKISLVDWFDAYPKTAQHEKTYPLQGRPKDLRVLMDYLAMNSIAFNDVDGVRVDTAVGWWLVRYSNTEDVLYSKAESYSKEDLKYLINELEHALQLALGS